MPALAPGPNRFAESKVYALCNSITHDVYVGSTVCSLAERLRWHRVGRRCPPGNVQRLVRDVGPEHFQISLLEAYPCASRAELRAREAVWVRRMGSVNQNIPGRTKAEHRREHPDREKAQSRRDYLRNRERCKARTKQWYAEHIGELRATLAQHHERNEAEMAQHMPWSLADRARIYPCPCGGNTSRASCRTHYRTMRHVKWLESLPEAGPEKELEPEEAAASGSGSYAELP